VVSVRRRSPLGAEIFEIAFDFVDHRLNVRTSRGLERSLSLRPQSLADFYRTTIDLLRSMDIAVALSETPNEVPNRSAFRKTGCTLPMTRLAPIASGARWCRRIGERGATHRRTETETRLASSDHVALAAVRAFVASKGSCVLSAASSFVMFFS
jgi:hypothetical protein